LNGRDPPRDAVALPRPCPGLAPALPNSTSMARLLSYDLRNLELSGHTRSTGLCAVSSAEREPADSEFSVAHAVGLFGYSTVQASLLHIHTDLQIVTSDGNGKHCTGCEKRSGGYLTIKSGQGLTSLGHATAAAVLRHPAQQAAVANIAQMIAWLRSCDKFSDFYEFQQFLFGHLYSVEERRNPRSVTGSLSVCEEGVASYPPMRHRRRRVAIRRSWEVGSSRHTSMSGLLDSCEW
jgi:hypothetical protein